MWPITFFVLCFAVGALMGYFIVFCIKRVPGACKKLVHIKEKYNNPLNVVMFGLVVLLLLKFVFPTSTYVDTALNAILVAVTLIYVLITKDILTDGQKARKIEFIQKQLESFYYPWLRFMEYIENAYLNLNSKRIHDDFFYMDCLKEMAPIFRKGDLELHKYQYLANENIRRSLVEIEQYFGFKCMEIDPAYVEDVTEIHQDDTGKYIDFIHPNQVFCEQDEIFNKIMSFKTDIESEIEKLNNNLIGYVR